ncbi:MAG: biotin synthase BioB [Planctomycetota bacterium]|nr:biotin synthase BioB [Planctomycetota bacterium]MDP6940809.1 biotin synthase BioB [Planctomycetota bacterium]
MAPSPSTTSNLSRESVSEIYRRPLMELVFQAAQVHREHHAPNSIQCSTLLSIKTGSCAEDCSYCSQSARNDSSLEPERLMDKEAVIAAAQSAKAKGSDRFCMGAAWRSIKDNADFDCVLEMVSSVKDLGLETCLTAGMLEPHQADKLRDAGLDYYNHNLDTSPEFYDQVVTTRTYEDRLETLAAVRVAGIKVCCGGILGMGESEEDRIGLIHELARQSPPPESVPINALVPIPGTPLAENPPLPWDQMVRAVATARILMPQSCIRLSAGRAAMTEEGQALCFLAGANSVFMGDKLLTTSNATETEDAALFRKLGVEPLNEPAPQGVSV